MANRVKARHVRAQLSFSAVAAVLAIPAASAQDQPASEQGGGLEEVIVTAQRREESAQKAAVAIDAIAADALTKSGISDASELNKLVPSLTIANGGGSTTSVYVRGVGNRTSSSYVDPAIAFSYDGVYLGRSSGIASAAFYDLQRVEVLKGPQGILYGRNATGGAINIITAKPDSSELSGYAMGEYGNYDAYQIQGALNLPVSDNSALRLAGSRVQRDGFNRDGTSDLDITGLRAQFLTELDRLTIGIGADYTKQGGIGPGATYDGTYFSGANGYTLTPSGLDENEGMRTDAANAYRRSLRAAPGFDFFGDIQDEWYQDNEFYGVNAEISYDTGAGTLTIIPAWRKAKLDNKWGVPAFNSGWVQETDTQSSLEVRFAGELSSMFDYIVGGYYFDEKIEADNTFNQEFVLPLQDYVHETESYAAFGNLTWHVTDTVRLAGGLRYTDDKKRMDGGVENFITFCGGLPPANLIPPAAFAQCTGTLPNYPTADSAAEAMSWLIGNGWIDPSTTLTGAPAQVIPLLNGAGTILKTNAPTNDTITKSKVTWRASTEWDVAPDSLLYATVETGYRSGGLQLAEGFTTFEPEYIDAYTLGSKNRFFDDTLQLNLEAFYWKYRDQQITYFALSGNTLVNITDNVGKSVSKGVDVDLVWAPTSVTQMNAKVQYLDATYDDLHFVTAAPRDNINCPFTLTGAVAGGAPVKDFDCSGNPAVYSPEWTVNLGIQQTVPLGAVDLIASVNTAWRDDQWGGFEMIEHEFIAAYWSTDLDLTLQSAQKSWAVTGYVRNVEDDRHRQSTVAAPTGQAMTIYTAPRTYGIRGTVRF